MQKLMEDLKFFIGAFFLILGLLLLAEGLLHPVHWLGYNLNIVAGISFLIFSAIPLFVCWREFHGPQR